GFILDFMARTGSGAEWRSLLRTTHSLRQLESAGAGFHHAGGEGEDAGCGLFNGYTAGVNVGDQVPVGVGVQFVGPIRHVGGEALGRRKTRAFSYEEDRDFGMQQFADFVQDPDPAVANHERLTLTPSARFRSFAHLTKTPRPL